MSLPMKVLYAKSVSAGYQMHDRLAGYKGAAEGNQADGFKLKWHSSEADQCWAGLKSQHEEDKEDDGC